MDILKQPRIDSLMIISQQAIGYISQVVKYLTLQSHKAPFPFSPWVDHYDA